MINIDETWLGMEDFTQMKWCLPGVPNSIPIKNLAPRISFIMALDSAGSGKFSLSYSNTNSDTFGLFIKHLVDHLNNTRKNWM